MIIIDEYEHNVQEYIAKYWLRFWLKRLIEFCDPDEPPEWEAKDYIVRKIRGIAYYIDDREFVKQILAEYNYQELAG